ncbi:MAG: hypothetical protein Ct9H300mP12_14860 [Acidimicrobiales bacterium]|nr:MAG: hypothetical protein Ct9H300mP12_14860 [Acidimicrobiales bacterium]
MPQLTSLMAGVWSTTRSSGHAGRVATVAVGKPLRLTGPATWLADHEVAVGE